MPRPSPRLRRVFGTAVLALALGAQAAVPAPGTWDRFKERFLHPEGRIVDTGQAGASHSEGQGLGMLFAVHFDDREAFERIWRWTDRNLGLRDDGLFVWRWVPGRSDPTEDPSSASDGDVLIAWAMLRAARRWGDPIHLDTARGLARSVRTNLITDVGGDTVLLPGPGWPQRESHTVVNLSYWVFPALQELATVDPSPAWEDLLRTGTALLTRARFGTWELPADWMALHPDGRLTQADDFPFVFGYEALRIPLYYVWAGFDRPEVLRIFQAFWSTTARGNRLVTMLGLATDRVIQQESVLAYRAVQHVVDCALTGRSSDLLDGTIGGFDDYYASAVFILARIAVEERLPRCLASQRSASPSPAPCAGAACPVSDPVPSAIAPAALIARVVDWLQLPSARRRRPLAPVVQLTHAGDGSGRIFVVDASGLIHVVVEDRLRPTPFLDLAALPLPGFAGLGPERGLRGIAFHPDFGRLGAWGEGRLYTVHTETSGPPGAGRYFAAPGGRGHHDDVLSEWRATGADRGRIDPGTRRELMRIAQPFPERNLAAIEFAPMARGGTGSRLLYVALGDGGSGDEGPEDPFGQAQDLRGPFGKLLRIDPGGASPYAIPPDNPFVHRSDALPEIWALGLRDPRGLAWNLDSGGTLLVTDRADGGVEEVNAVPPGANLGWSLRQGRFAVHPDRPHTLYENPSPREERFVDPVAAYDGDDGRAIGGGVVYRGTRFPGLRGQYVFADEVAGRIFFTDAGRLAAGEPAPVHELRLFYNGAEKSFLDILNNDVRADLRLGVDEAGELYAASGRDAVIRRILPLSE